VLVTIDEVEVRFKTTFEGDERTYIEALMEDVSNLVRVIAKPELDDVVAPLTGNLRALIPIIVKAIRRGRENPRGLTGENLGDYGWQSNSGQNPDIGLTRNEKRMIRRIVGKLGVESIRMEGEMPVLASSDIIFQLDEDFLIGD
jgi:hypothetical protein